MSPAIFSEAKDEKTGPATGVLAQLRACPPTRPTCTPKDSEWSHRIPGLKLVGRNTRKARVNCVQSLRPGKACEAHDGPQPTASTWPSSPKTLEVWVLPVGEKGEVGLLNHTHTPCEPGIRGTLGQAQACPGRALPQACQRTLSSKYDSHFCPSGQPPVTPKGLLTFPPRRREGGGPLRPHLRAQLGRPAFLPRCK